MHITCCFHSDHPGVDEWLALLGAALPGARVTRWTEGPSDADYAVVWQPSQAFFDSRAPLRAVFNAGAGVDAVLKLRRPAGVPLIRLEDAGMGEQMVDYVSYALLGFYREFDVYARQQHAGAWVQRTLLDKRDFAVGILGYGVLGSQVAERVRLLGFPVHGWARSAKPDADVDVFHGAQGLETFLAQTRVLVCLLPLTADTRGIIDRALLSALKPGAYLINIARGGHVVEADLLALLDSGQVAGAMVDVTQEEPLPPGHAIWTHPRVAMTPHIAAVTVVNDAAAQIAQKIAALERGESVTGIVSEQGY